MPESHEKTLVEGIRRATRRGRPRIAGIQWWHDSLAAAAEAPAVVVVNYTSSSKNDAGGASSRVDREWGR